MRRYRPARCLLATAALGLLAATAACGAASTPPGGTGHAGTSTAPPPPGPTPSSTAAETGGREGVPAVAHLFVVVMENLGAQRALAVPQLSGLVARYQSTTGWYAVSHPSLPNYLALVSGSTWGVASDCTSCYESGPDLATQLDAAGISWGAYFEDMPGPCYLGPQSPDGGYAQKHDPFAYFEDVRSSPVACAHLQPLDVLEPLLDGPPSDVPRLVWVTPSLCHSGHDCSPDSAGAWLTGFAGRVTASAAWRAGGVLVVVWDEGDGDAGMDPRSGAVSAGGGGGAVLALVAVSGAPAGRTLPGPYNHYSLLRTIEDALDLPYLGEAGEPGVHALGAFFAGGGAGAGGARVSGGGA